MNFASKKLYSHFEQLALVHRIRDPLEDLYIPKTYQKLVKALIFETISEPKMVSLYINSIYEQNPQLLFTNEAVQVMLETAFNVLLLTVIVLELTLNQGSQLESDESAGDIAIVQK